MVNTVQKKIGNRTALGVAPRLKAREERERNGKTLKAFSFQPPLRILNAFYPDMFEVCILLSV